MTGDEYAFPPATLNSVTSVTSFSHRSPCREVAVQDVLGDLALLSPIGVVSPASYATAKAFLAHQLERGLAADGKSLLGSEDHGDLAVSHSVGDAGEASRRSGRTSAHLSALGTLSSCVMVVGALGKPELVEHEHERIMIPSESAASARFLPLRRSENSFFNF